MGQIFANLAGRFLPPAFMMKEKNKITKHGANRIELLVRLVICNKNPVIQCHNNEIIFVQQQHKSNKSANSGRHSSSFSSSSSSSFAILFDRCCLVNAILGDSVHEIIPDVLDFAYDYKNYPLTFDGAFTVKFGKMAQIRPRTVEVEHGMDVAVVFHLKGPKEHSNERTTNMEAIREDNSGLMLPQMNRREFKSFD